MDFVNDRPIFLQVAEYIEKEILLQTWKPGEKLPSVREFALMLQVNPNTVQKALQLLEGKDLIFTRRASGKFVTENKEVILSLKMEQGKARTEEYVQTLMELGYTKEEILKLIREVMDHA